MMILKATLILRWLKQGMGLPFSITPKNIIVVSQFLATGFQFLETYWSAVAKNCTWYVFVVFELICMGLGHDQAVYMNRN
jgi:hypothetical protein